MRKSRERVKRAIERRKRDVGASRVHKEDYHGGQ